MPYKDIDKRKECARETYHRNKERNREKRNERDRKRYHDNVEYQRERIRKNTVKRKEENPEVFRKWDREKRKNDTIYRVKKNLSRRMRNFLKGKYKSQSTLSIIGLTYEGLREHFESQFEPWMSWDNYGKYKIGTFNYGWDIDHIIPTSTAKTEEELLKLNYYTNLKPLCSKVNRDIKKDKV